MPLDEDISVGVVSIDRQHMGLIDIIDEVFSLLRSGENRKALVEGLDALVLNTTEHFEHEERVMRNIGLPGVEAHRKIHRSLLDEVRQFRVNALGLRTSAAIDEAQHLLRHWLFNHIVTEDSKIGKHINRR